MSNPIHHLTAITGNAQANIDFYVGLLGLRLVKRTVSHSDTSTLHLFYGDGAGSPGTILSFFAWPDTAQGRRGFGQATAIGLLLALDSLGDWMTYLLGKGVRFTGPERVDGATRLTLQDPDGLSVALVFAADAPAGYPWAGSTLPENMQIRGIHHAEFWTEDVAATGGVLERHFGFREVAEADGLHTFRTGSALGNTVYVRNAAGFWPAAGGVGTLHHVAFSAADAEQEAQILEAVTAEGLQVSEVREHGYFKSIYFIEPGGSIIEVATNTPGFGVDEDAAHLGERLVLPPELEARRGEIELHMPHISLPHEERRPERDLAWVHRFIEGTSRRTLLLLHGTGGNELDLLSLGRSIDPQANLLSVRGRSLEEGAPRFFRRFSATQYDQPHLIAEADALADFVRDAAELYGLDAGQVYAVGYSNGANIALASLLQQPQAYAGAVLLRPVQALEHPPKPDLRGKRVLILSGQRDPFASMGKGIAPLLREAGADVTETVQPAGHELTQNDIVAAQTWLKGEL